MHIYEREALMVVEKTMSHNNNQIKTMVTTTTCAAAIDHLYQLIMRAAINDENLLKTGSLNHYKSFVFKTFHLTSDMIESCLKKVLVLDEKGSIGFSCSSYEVAHLWKVNYY